MVRDTLLVPENIQPWLEGLRCGKNEKHENLVRKLARFTDGVAGVEAQKQATIDLYAAGGLAKDAYVAENIALDHEIRRLRKRRAQIEKELKFENISDCTPLRHRSWGR